MTTRIAMFGCAHLGYAPQGLRRSLPDGTNVVAGDGYTAHRLIMSDICDVLSDPALAGRAIVDGGDLFHAPKPGPASIEAALAADQIRVDAGIHRYVIPGNHDRTGAASIPASAVLRYRPGCHVVAPLGDGPDTDEGDTNRMVVSEGLYEVWSVPGNTPVYLHLINEQALAPAASDMDPAVDPRPIEGGTNLLITHGIAPSAQGVLYHHGADERGGERIIPSDWFDRGFDYVMLSDLHTPHMDTIGSTPMLYTGSAVRRGFSDDETGRGWVLLTIDDQGTLNIQFRSVWQRPAVDLVLDASGKSADEIEEMVDEALDGVTATDEESGSITGESGIRVRVTVCDVDTTALPALTEAQTRWTRSCPEALSFELRLRPAGVADETSTADALDELPSFGAESPEAALRRMAGGCLAETLANFDDERRARIIDIAAEKVVDHAGSSD